MTLAKQIRRPFHSIVGSATLIAVLALASACEKTKGGSVKANVGRLFGAPTRPPDAFMRRCVMFAGASDPTPDFDVERLQKLLEASVASNAHWRNADGDWVLEFSSRDKLSGQESELDAELDAAPDSASSCPAGVATLSRMRVDDRELTDQDITMLILAMALKHPDLMPPSAESPKVGPSQLEATPTQAPNALSSSGGNTSAAPLVAPMAAPSPGNGDEPHTHPSMLSGDGWRGSDGPPTNGSDASTDKPEALRRDITDPTWTTAPSLEEVKGSYPESADPSGAYGQATLRCEVGDSGRLSYCTIVSETPPDRGFGEAALRLSRLYTAAPRSRSGYATAGATVRFAVNLWR